MCDHYIIMSSSYTDGVRVALDVTDSDLICEEHIYGLIAEIKKQCGEDIPLSSHLIQTESSSWDSVVRYDPFFSSVYVASSLFDFIAKVRESRILTGIDVAHYILSKIPCTHLSLEKLVYFSYSDYLCGHMKCLFDDRIFDFTHGPVIQSVYEAYKRSGYRHVNRYDDGMMERFPRQYERCRLQVEFFSQKTVWTKYAPSTIRSGNTVVFLLLSL